MSSTEAGASIPVLFEDAYLLAVNKPAGMPAQPDPTGDADLLTMIAAQRGGGPPGLVHRLDRPVSGVMILALDQEVLAALNALFQDRAVRKRYWAIVEGAAVMPEWRTLEHHLAHDTKAKRARVFKGGTSTDDVARLRIRSLAAGERYTLLEVEPEGGAFHQIRAQLAAAGHPIKGDVKYGARRGEKDRSIGLHARSISFDHPITGKKVDVLAPAPSGPLWNALLGLVAPRAEE
ncbi:MAG: RluA family pseudouridine synthase [Flavobacteriales bacterium]